MTFLQLDTHHYVYGHSRNDDGSVFYIGKGSGNRLRRTSRRNAYWKNIVSKAGGFTPFVIAGHLTEEDAYKFERLLIGEIQKQTGFKLSNLIGGGRGGSYNPSHETRAKQRAAKLGSHLSECHRMKIAEANRHRTYVKGYKLSLTDAQRDARAERTRNQIWTDERRERISKAKTGHIQSEETKKKISIAKRGKPWTDAQRIQIMAGRNKGGI